MPFAPAPTAEALGRSSSSTAPARTPTARRTTSPGCTTRTRRSTRSTASSRSTWTRAASRARGRRSSSTSTRRRRRTSEKLAANAQWFEDHMPWDAEVPQAGRQGDHGQRDRGGDRDGRLGPDHADRHQPAQRPGDPRAVRQQVGVAVQRHRGLRQVDAAGASAREFSWTAEEADAGRASGARSSGELLVNMHEVIGHASGRVAEAADGKPRRRCEGALLGAGGRPRPTSWRSTSCADPKLAELGLVAAEDQAEIVRAEYEVYTRNALVAAAAGPRGHAARGGPHAQPPDDRALADGQHQGHRDARSATARPTT